MYFLWVKNSNCLAPEQLIWFAAMKISAAKNIKLHLAIYLSARITAVVVPETSLVVRFYVGRSKSLVEKSRASLRHLPCGPVYDIAARACLGCFAFRALGNWRVIDWDTYRVCSLAPWSLTARLELSQIHNAYGNRTQTFPDFTLTGCGVTIRRILVNL